MSELGGVGDDQRLLELLRSYSMTASAIAEVGMSMITSTPLVVPPFAGDGGGDVGLVLHVGDDEFDRLAEHLAAEILDRHCGPRMPMPPISE